MSSAPATHGAEAVDGSSTRLAALRTFHTLDALRGVAAVAIVFYHAAFFYGVSPPPEGHVAVDLFFVMSGFIIAYRYEADLLHGLSLARFVKLRLIRLYPLFLLGAVLGVLPSIIALLHGDHDAFHTGLVESFPLAVLMLPSHFVAPRIEELYPLNYVAWSLALEIVVNIAYAASVRLWTVRRLAILAIVAALGLAVCAVLTGTLKYGYAWPQAPVGPVRIVYGFTMGILIFRLTRGRLSLPRIPWWAPLIVTAAVFVLFPPIARPVWEWLVVVGFVPTIILVAVAVEPPRGLRSVCATAGVYSYAIYSLHAPLVSLFLRGEDRLHQNLQVQTLGDAIAFTLVLAASCVVAQICYDRPVRRYLTSRLSQRRALATRPAVGHP